MEYVWNFIRKNYSSGGWQQACAKCEEVAEALTRQNMEGRQAIGYPPRRFIAEGPHLYARPLDL